MTKTKLVKLHVESGFPSPGDVVTLRKDAQYFATPKSMRDAHRMIRRPPTPVFVVAIAIADNFARFFDAMLVVPLGYTRYHWVFLSDIDQEIPRWRV